MLNIKNICDVEAMREKDWQEAIKEEFGSWVKDWPYSLVIIAIMLVLA